MSSVTILLGLMFQTYAGHVSTARKGQHRLNNGHEVVVDDVVIIDAVLFAVNVAASVEDNVKLEQELVDDGNGAVETDLHRAILHARLADVAREVGVDWVLARRLALAHKANLCITEVCDSMCVCPTKKKI